MTWWQAMLWAMGASACSQALDFGRAISENGWPQERTKRLIYIFSFLVTLISAGFVAALMFAGGQISGPIGAAGAGVGAEKILQGLVAAGGSVSSEKK